MNSAPAAIPVRCASWRWRVGKGNEPVVGHHATESEFKIDYKNENFSYKNKSPKMKRLTTLTTIILAIVIISCRTTHNISNNNIMDKEKIKSEIIQAENDLISTYRQGDFMKALSIEVNSPEFRSIVNGKTDTYETLVEKYKKLTIDKTVKGMDYKIESQDFNFINADNVLVTLKVNLTTTMNNGTAFAKPLAETILWQRVENKWRIGHYHATEIPKGN